MSNAVHTYTIRVSDEGGQTWPAGAVDALGFPGATVRARKAASAAKRVMAAARSAARRSGEYIADENLTVVIFTGGFPVECIREQIGPGPGQRWRGQEP